LYDLTLEQGCKSCSCNCKTSLFKWIELRKPRVGLAYENMKNSRKNFKYVLHKAKCENEQLFADNMAASLVSDQSSTNF